MRENNSLGCFREIYTQIPHFECEECELWWWGWGVKELLERNAKRLRWKERSDHSLVDIDNKCKTWLSSENNRISCVDFTYPRPFKDKQGLPVAILWKDQDLLWLMGKHPGKSGMWVWILTLQLIYGVIGAHCLSFLVYNTLFCKISTVDFWSPMKYLSHLGAQRCIFGGLSSESWAGVRWGSSPPTPFRNICCRRVASGLWLVKCNLWVEWTAALGAGPGTRHPTTMFKLLNDRAPPPLQVKGLRRSEGKTHWWSQRLAEAVCATRTGGEAKWSVCLCLPALASCWTHLPSLFWGPSKHYSLPESAKW